MILHYYKQFYTGPSAPGSLQPRKLTAALAEAGHTIYVVAGDINIYNEQREPEEELLFEGGGRIIVHRIKGAVDIRRSLKARLDSYIGYVRPALALGKTLPPADAVIASIQPLFTAWVGRKLARRYRAPWLLEVRDLWPDALEAKNAIKAWQAAPLHWLANSLYRSADRIVSVTPGIKTELVKKGLPANRLDVFPNGFDPELFQVHDGDRERVRKERGWGDEIVCLFTGTHTEVTAVDTLVRAAAHVPQDAGIRFDFVGYGQTKPKVMALAEELGLKHVHFHDPVPKSGIPALIAGADICMMSLFESPLIHIYFENKLMDYMGAARPIVAAMGGEQADLLTRAGAGRVVPAFQAEALAREILDLVDKPELRAEMGMRGRKLVDEQLLLPDILQRYVKVIEEMAAGNAGRIAAWEPFA